MTATILQPSYVPWRGYFHQIRKSDVFVFYDDVQYDKHGWRNRNRIKTAHGTQWLTIPVHSRGNVSRGLPINEIRIDWATDWARSHRDILFQAYRRAPHFDRYWPLVEPLYGGRPELLAEFTIGLTTRLAGLLDIQPVRFVRSSEIGGSGAKTDRLLHVLGAVGATHYLSGPSARDYLEEDRFVEAGVTLEYMRYDYPEYPQLYPPFDPRVSILDLLFMTGPDAPKYIWGP